MALVRAGSNPVGHSMTKAILMIIAGTLVGLSFWILSLVILFTSGPSIIGLLLAICGIGLLGSGLSYLYDIWKLTR